MSNLLTIDEVSEKIRLKRSTIYKLICMKKIPYLKLGSRVLFDPDRLDEWVQEHNVEPINER